ncbi:beta strand repeat-containing protein [Sulfitobacter sp.]|uniref:beta strand repeat-containing protein n=1 Tax=Sulfitobacter sp. TaxID=1903071 RepID=UPI003EF11A79
MTPIALLALLGLALFVPVFMDDDDNTETAVDPVDPAEPVDPVGPVDPVEPTVVNGTADAEALTAASNQTVNGFSGADTITADADVTGATIDGGRDDDTLNISGTNNVADGFRGNDTFEIGGDGNLANGGDGSDTFAIDATNTTINGGSGNDSISIAEDSSNIVANGGQGEDELSASGNNITLNGNAGDDVINYSAASGTANGGGGNDTITASAEDQGLGGSLFGEDGEDVLSVAESAASRGSMLLDGGLNNDDLNTSSEVNEGGISDTLTGGEGDDTFGITMNFSDTAANTAQDNLVTITDYTPGEDSIQINANAPDGSGFLFDGLELSEAADGSYTDIISTFASTTDGVANTISTVRVMGATDLSLDDIFLTTAEEATEGNDILEARDTQADVFEGRGGDDILTHDARDDGRDLTLSGGEGNDTLIANELEIGINTTLDGGAGDDVLRTNINQAITTGQGVETFITGEGSDTIEISVINRGEDDTSDVGMFGEVTDFTPGEDIILLDSSFLLENTSGGFAEGFTQTLTLTEAADGAYTDVAINLIANANDNSFAGTIRLLGATGLTETDIGFTVGAPS